MEPFLFWNLQIETKLLILEQQELNCMREPSVKRACGLRGRKQRNCLCLFHKTVFGLSGGF
jgi:hypothetical protein